MASSSSERVPITTALAITPAGSRVLQNPISEGVEEKRLKEASIKKEGDDADLIANVAKPESEVCLIDSQIPKRSVLSSYRGSGLGFVFFNSVYCFLLLHCLLVGSVLIWFALQCFYFWNVHLFYLSNVV